MLWTGPQVWLVEADHARQRLAPSLPMAHVVSDGTDPTY
jgi:hypothetical protein